MNRNILILVGVAIFIGYLLGKSDSNSSFNAHSGYSSTPSRGDLEDENDELRQKLDDARDKAEDAVSAAEDVEDSATMRYLNTGRFEDQMRMHDAEDAADKAREARDSLDN
jgi:hypothetical protein